MEFPPKTKKKGEAEKLPPKDFEGTYEAAPGEEAPIVMLNSILSKQAGVREKKARKPRVSVSMGGDAYVPKIFEELDTESEITTGEAEDQAPISVELRDQPIPETYLEQKQAFQRTVGQLNYVIAEKRADIARLEREAMGTGVRESDRFAAHVLERDETGKVIERVRQEHVPDANERITQAEKELIAAEKDLAEKRELSNSIIESAVNDNYEDTTNLLYFKERTKVSEDKLAEKVGALPPDAYELYDTTVTAAAEPERKKGKGKNIAMAVLASISSLGAAPAPSTRAEVLPKQHETHAPRTPATVRASEQITIGTAAHTNDAPPPVRIHKESTATIERGLRRPEQLFADLHHRLLEKYPRGEGTKGIAHRILSSPDASRLAHIFNFEKGDRVAKIQPGDSLDIDSKGQLVFTSGTHKLVLAEPSRQAPYYQIAHLYPDSKLQGINEPNRENMIDELYRAMHTKGTPEKPQPGLAPNFEHSPEYTEMLKESNAGLPVHYPNVRKTTPKSTIERPAVSTPPIVAAPAIEKPAAPAVAEQPVPSAHTESGGEQSIAHRYLDARGNIIFMGGTLQQRYDRAYQYFKGIALPEKDTVQQLFVVGESKDPETGEPSMRPLTRDATGNITMGSIVRDRWTGIAMLPPNLKEVTKQAD